MMTKFETTKMMMKMSLIMRLIRKKDVEGEESYDDDDGGEE